MSGDTGANKHFKYIIIGGGIGGVTCAETLSSLRTNDNILLISASPLIKTVTNIKMVTNRLEDFDVEEKPAHILEEKCGNVQVVHATVSSINTQKHEVYTSDEQVFHYDRLNIATGGTPRLIATNNQHVIGIRDTETVQAFQSKLGSAKRIIVVGNGGIATEIVYDIQECEIIWAIKDESIVNTFVDPGAAQFFMEKLSVEKEHKTPEVSKHRKYTTESTAARSTAISSVSGSALGPDWSAGLPLHGINMGSRKIHIEYEVEIESILTPEEVKPSHQLVNNPFQKLETTETADKWPVYVKLTNGKVYGCDFVVSATGVTPNTTPFLKNNSFSVADDGGLKVNDKMKTSIEHVYASGDVCTAGWDPSPHWIQMRLWSQARQMGHYAAKCMVAGELNEDISLDFCFELFAHVTKFFGYKVILLGKFNAQGLGTDYEMLLRVTEGVEYVKVILHQGRMAGSILIGETDLEETFENLILNGMDLTRYGEDLLDPNMDIEDYFD